ncbi:MAG: tRNA (N(6)-L-threonylcarbamoyladenosine(37)-C(2))-methylthiotransferase MtaB [Candidatus Omnitrophica bacterium]|nr:tRNA (N(6)-L-threonylcarbamoyladenosine(37)-C(2))-methylthiotransferase MtaB [Candidatus Omnitrophota bacterium]
MKKVHFSTLGCKTNQYETQAMREKFLRAGYAETEKAAEADLLVVNTCTVTGDGDRKSRFVIRRLHRDNPAAKIAVTGCYATFAGNELQTLPGVSHVIPNQEKDRIVQHIAAESVGKFCGSGDKSEDNRYSDLSISYFADRARAFLKIQDGCDHSCTYCKVVLVRGASRSRPLEEIAEEGRRLSQNGYREVVLTGIQLGAYGDEWSNGINLRAALERLTRIPGLERIRMSSIDPSDVDEDLMRFIQREPKICRHFHLPLQSGDNTILKLMRRAYRRERFLEIVRRLRELMPDFAITTDVMVGFPGEGEDEFGQTAEVIEAVLPLKVHIFPFSPREGTQAASFPGRPAAAAVQDRYKRLQSLSDRASLKFRERFLGRRVEVLVEGSEREGLQEGHTSEYLKVRFRPSGRPPGSLFSVRLESLDRDFFIGSF